MWSRISTIDQENRTIFANARMAAMLGCSIDEMTGASLFDFLDNEWKAIAGLNVERH
jgi:PAS domain-containing protein